MYVYIYTYIRRDDHVEEQSVNGNIFFPSNATTCPLRLRGPPPGLLLKCNRLLKSGRPVGAVTLSRWEWWWDKRWIWGARGAL